MTGPFAKKEPVCEYNGARGRVFPQSSMWMRSAGDSGPSSALAPWHQRREAEAFGVYRQAGVTSPRHSLRINNGAESHDTRWDAMG
jgi:hypothetical protein